MRAELGDPGGEPPLDAGEPEPLGTDLGGLALERLDLLIVDGGKLAGTGAHSNNAS